MIELKLFSVGNTTEKQKNIKLHTLNDIILEYIFKINYLNIFKSELLKILNSRKKKEMIDLDGERTILFSSIEKDYPLYELFQIMKLTPNLKSFFKHIKNIERISNTNFRSQKNSLENFLKVFSIIIATKKNKSDFVSIIEETALELQKYKDIVISYSYKKLYVLNSIYKGTSDKKYLLKIEFVVLRKRYTILLSIV